ncbi:hypothetical protein ACHAP7_003937 [Fusarium lateritium]
MPTENTVQADVGPGDETGIYYITICNLPFGTSWQQLKDWTRTACVVDHIEVFQSSTSGWVRVRGRENFERAWVFANPPKSIYVADTTMRTLAVLYIIWTAYGAIAPRRHYTYDEGTTRAFPVKANAVTYSPEYQHQAVQFALPYRSHDEYPAYYADCSLASNEPSYRSEYVVTEPRKLHVSPFPQQARADEVKSWVRRKVDKTKIESMEIPKNSNSRYLRGYVLVVFDSVASANTAIDQLNKARFQGRRVIARPTSEGAKVEEPSGPYEASSQVEFKSEEGHIPTDPSRNRSNDDRKNEKTQRPKNKETKSVDSEKKRVSEKKLSSSKKTSASHTDRKSSSKKASTDEKVPRKDQGPVIVDGTCHRHDKR